ncbi:DUF2849 domain-containing protein [Rhodospirillum rubrum]|uniref:DUF2849 domain-containing protein n=1 Tax=Rhodospirillum rubrum (strain ATCC 11170 / ATH 1.1.1 / DSM 467 / LMG 4362 / NCIMB 8255 / S1) TaxID=269796 RepID=Q2RT13_RHORT|nr:DUF2849 domain-containing protein [Rhodospirillum rubrum]ABC22732.1 hypothetical protein Rru_A1932 [Rhodospirillum rubrum ATCC 11170]AEO48452.1 hypothetical protein F11_09930 [Rhodospirillum rubrum F11]MBK5954330.1 hypothetical protein [Rhodospirillum rubrum]QXG78724.1 DUF2849 domain-containing protein [Rhodospirillum rubrum]HAQ00528.1 DUF2849 domain-containing protein [Rhodospirillum rubrum]
MTSSDPVKAGSVFSAEVITANRLTDGKVVYRRGDGGWSADLAEALTLSGEALAAELDRARAEPDTAVVGIYSHALEGGEPAHLRERIRAQGPTVQAGAGLPLSKIQSKAS